MLWKIKTDKHKHCFPNNKIRSHLTDTAKIKEECQLVCGEIQGVRWGNLKVITDLSQPFLFPVGLCKVMLKNTWPFPQGCKTPPKVQVTDAQPSTNVYFKKKWVLKQLKSHCVSGLAFWLTKIVLPTGESPQRIYHSMLGKVLFCNSPSFRGNLEKKK